MSKESGRTTKAVRNVLWTYGNQFLMLILSFLSRTVFIWVFGVEYLGLNGIFTDILGMLSLTDLGLNSAMVYSFYDPLAKRDKRKIAALVQFYRKIYITIAIIVFLLGICLIPFLPYIVNIQHNIPYINIYFIFAVANISASYLFVYKTSVLTADQKNYIVVRIGMIVNMIKIIIQIVTMLIFADYIVYLLLDLCGNLISNAIASHQTQKTYPFLREKAILSYQEKNNIRKTIFSGMLYKISSVLLNATDNILISILVSTAAVGYYSNYLMIQTKATMFYSMAFTSITASIGNLMVQAAVEKRYQIFRIEQTISSIVCLIFIPCYLLLIDDFIMLWLGTGFVLNHMVVLAIGCNMYLSCILQPLWSYREATGLYRKTKYVMLVCAFANIILSIIFGMIWGIFGIIIASAIARLSTYVWYEPAILFKQYFQKDVQSYYIGLLREAVYIVVLIIISERIFIYFSVNSWLMWGVKATLCIGVFSIISLLLHCRQPGFYLLKDRCCKFLVSKNDKV